MILFCHKLSVAFNDSYIKGDNYDNDNEDSIKFKKTFYSVSDTGGSYEKIPVVKPVTFWPWLFKR